MDFFLLFRVWKYIHGQGTEKSSPTKAWSFRRWQRRTPGTTPARPSTSRVRWSHSPSCWTSCVSVQCQADPVSVKMQILKGEFPNSLHFVTNCQTILRLTNHKFCKMQISTGNSIMILYFDFSVH